MPVVATQHGRERPPHTEKGKWKQKGGMDEWIDVRVCNSTKESDRHRLRRGIEKKKEAWIHKQMYVFAIIQIHLSIDIYIYTYIYK